MLKVGSSCLLLTTLVFSSAHAPTFQLWRSLPDASADANASETRATYSSDAQAGMLAYANYALTGEYDAANDFERVELGDLSLPALKVELPDVFAWSATDRIYLASNAMPVAFGFGLGNPKGFAHSASAATGLSAGGIGGFGGASTSNAKGAYNTAGSQSDVSTDQARIGAIDSEDESQEPPADAVESAPSDQPAQNSSTDESDDSQTQDLQFAKNELPIESLLPTISDPPQSDATRVDSHKPVQVPAPAPLGLFVLGLAALRCVGRKKNGSG